MRIALIAHDKKKQEMIDFATKYAAVLGPYQRVAATRDVRGTVDYDAILDRIDAVLEADAQEYVRSFVQKGGQ